MKNNNSANQILQVISMLVALSASITLCGASYAAALSGKTNGLYKAHPLFKRCYGSDCPKDSDNSRVLIWGGYAVDGYTEDGYTEDGYTEDGYTEDGYTGSNKYYKDPLKTPGAKVHQALPAEPPPVETIETGTIFDEHNVMYIVRSNVYNFPIDGDGSFSIVHRNKVISAFIDLFNRLPASSTRIQRESDQYDRVIPRLSRQSVFGDYPVVVGQIAMDPKPRPVLGIRFKVKQERVNEEGEIITVTCGEGVSGFDGVFQVSISDSAALGAGGWKTAHSLEIFPDGMATKLLTGCLKRNDGSWKWNIFDTSDWNVYNTIFSEKYVPVYSKEGRLVNSSANGNVNLRQLETILALVRDGKVNVYMAGEDPYTLELDMTPEQHHAFIRAVGLKSLPSIKEPITAEDFGLF